MKLYIINKNNIFLAAQVGSAQDTPVSHVVKKKKKLQHREHLIRAFDPGGDSIA